MGKKQMDIPGTERKAIKAIEEKAEEYQELKEKRSAILSKEIACKGQLHELMKKHGETNYKCRDSDLMVSLISTEETIKVKHVESDEEAAEALKA